MTDAEITFINRMAPHIMAGKTFEEAARAVLDDDQRIYNAVSASKEIQSQISSSVYHAIRASYAIKRVA